VKRTWVKLFCNQWLNGSARHDPLEVRALWVDLLAIAGEFGGDGRVRITENTPFSDENIAKMMKVKPSIWRKVKSYLIQNGRITVDIDGFLTITKWSTYQSEYQRTKTAPSRKSTTESTAKSTSESTPLEVEVRSKKRDIEESKKSQEIARTTEKKPVVRRPRSSPSSSSAKKEKEPPPPAVEAYREVARMYPHKSTWEEIDSTVGTGPLALTLWRDTVTAWIAVGFKPTNVSGMLDNFNRGELPGKDHPGSNGSPKVPMLNRKAQAWADLPCEEEVASETQKNC
jgi:hypothetical protein